MQLDTDNSLGDAPVPSELRPITISAPVPVSAPQRTQSLPAVAPSDPSPFSARAFGDSDALRTQIYSGALKAASGLPPLENTKHRLTLTDVHYDGPETYSLRDQKRAILESRSLGRKLQGVWTLSDKATGHPVGTRRTTLATIPFYTPRGTFIQNGVEYTLAHQFRLRPGVYSRLRDNGEIESHVNILPGQGAGHRVELEPETGVFRLKFGQSRLPLVPLLRASGVPDSKLREVWGDDLANANFRVADSSTIDKLHQRLIRGAAPYDPTERGKSVAAAFAAMKLDPDVMQRTLGKPYDRMTPDVYLDTTKKLLGIARGTEEPDDRDNLAYMTIHGPEDLISERLARPHQRLRRAFWKASVKGDMSALAPNLMTKAVEAALITSGLGQPGESTNPLTILDQQGRVTRLGEGGIPDISAIPDESRSVQPSQLGYVDFLATPESLAAGVDSRMASSTRKGSDGRLYSPFIDARTGDLTVQSPHQLADKVVTFPGSMDRPGNKVMALVGGRLRRIAKDRVDYILPSMESALSATSNLVPGKSTIKGQRVAMAGRMIGQALPVVDAEAPWVQNLIPGSDGKTFESHYGVSGGAIRAKTAGKVTAITPEFIEIEAQDGTKQTIETAVHMPYNRKTGLNQIAAVRIGDPVQPGDLLATSNYTDKSGTLALGRNARVAYIPFEGRNYEDAWVISQSFADKMTSDHLYQHALEVEDGVQFGKNVHVSAFPGRYSKSVLDNFDTSGVIKPGTRVHQGDPLILAVKEKAHSLNRVHSGHSRTYSDQTETWEHHEPGIVTDIAQTPKGIRVVVQSTMRMKSGDKISGRHGDKGLVAHIYPDDKMPRDSEGRPFELLVNPLGLLTRTNAGQIVETALGKIASKTGKAIALGDFDSTEDAVEFAQRQLKDNGMTDTETITDPSTGRQIPDVFTGNRWFMKLTHTAESKAQGRGLGSYSSDGSPSKSGKDGTGSKRLALMDLNALLSHGATAVIRDGRSVRGQDNPDYWTQFMSGHTPPPVKVPFVHTKFINTLRAGGINPVREGRKTQFMALTDKDVDALAGSRELSNADTVDPSKGLKPIAGGLFDQKLTGSHDGKMWSAIPLAEPMLNPVMEEPTRRLLNLTEAKFRDVMAGRAELAGDTGPSAIHNALKSLNVDKEIEEARQAFSSGRKTAKDSAARRLRYLKSTKALGIHPGEWVLKRAPVLPPAFRPISVMAGGVPLVSDANYLYRELHEANSNLKELTGKISDVGEERLALYDAFKAVVGLGEPTHPKNQERKVKGALRSIFGNSPKYSYVQRKLLSGTTDLVGRSAIIPDPDLDLDSAGIPEDRAWSVYRPFMVRRLVRSGMKHMDAARAVEERSDPARRAMLEELKVRPVILNRAPVLHRYGVMAFWPKLVKGDALRINPFVTTGYGADFDGDQMNYSVPVEEDAVNDAINKMMPSRNLYAPSNFKVHQVPSKEFAGGLYSASTLKDETKPERSYATARDAIAAYRRGEIHVNQPVKIHDR